MEKRSLIIDLVDGAIAGALATWVMGAVTTALYEKDGERERPRLGAASSAGGLVFGAAFWLLADEGANTALGLTPGPGAFPWQTHARGLAGHLAFGAVANTTLAAVQRVA